MRPFGYPLRRTSDRVRHSYYPPNVATLVTPIRPPRSAAAPVLVVAFAVVALSFGSEFLYDVEIATIVALALSAGATLAGALLAATIARRNDLGRWIGATSFGPFLVRPPITAVALVVLSLCGLVGWLAVAPETTTGAQAAGATVVTLLLYTPAWLLYLGTFALAVLVPDPTAISTPAVRTVVFVGGAALSAVWQLLLASALVRGVTGSWPSASGPNGDGDAAAE